MSPASTASSGANRTAAAISLVSGRGSTWANAGELRVGDVSGQGTLSIESGGAVSNRDSYVGSMSGNGEVVVRGAGSTWNNSRREAAAPGRARAALTIGQGGAVNVGAAGTGIVPAGPVPDLSHPRHPQYRRGAGAAGHGRGHAQRRRGPVRRGHRHAELQPYRYRLPVRDTVAEHGQRAQPEPDRRHHALTGANGAFLGKATVSGGKLVVLGSLGGSAQVTGGTLQYGDGAWRASRLAGDLKVSGAGNAGGAGAGDVGGDGRYRRRTHSRPHRRRQRRAARQHGDARRRRDLPAGGVDSASPAEVVLIDTAGGINGDFARISTGGFAGAVDYLSVNTRKSADTLQYLARYGLAWTAGNNLAHGTLTLANATDRFTVGAALTDQANAATGWNGTTLTKAGAGTLVLSGANTQRHDGLGGALQVERDANLATPPGRRSTAARWRPRRRSIRRAPLW